MSPLGTPRRITVHCAATAPDWLADRPLSEQIAAIRRYHVGGLGWADIGYHLLIGRDGCVGAGRPLDRMGAHVGGHNRGNIGVCLIGGLDSRPDDAFADHFTPQQDHALRAQIRRLRADYPQAPLALWGHNDFPGVAKACPGFRVAVWAEARGIYLMRGDDT